MGKKHVITQSQEEVIKENDKMEAGLKKEAKSKQAVLKVSEGKVFIS